MKQPLVILTGPTAVGKTDLSIELAKQINGEIISADSIQVYKYMDIGSAKILPDEMNGIKHYLVDELEPDEEFNVYIFQEMTKKYIDAIYAKGKIPIIVGGTGFYIQSILYDICFTDTETDPNYRNELMQLAQKHGNTHIHGLLSQVDAISANEIHENNLKRVIRALEYYKQTGEPISIHNKEQRQKVSPYNFVYFVANNHREVLYDRINQRVDIMFDKGLKKEVQNLKELGYNRNLVSMQGIGYKEMYAHIEGEMSAEDTAELIKKETRHFAKRQLTWFRREQEVTWINYFEHNDNKKDMIKEMIEILKTKKILGA